MNREWLAVTRAARGKLTSCGTSGLDASIALSVMQVLKDIAATGRTVIGASVYAAAKKRRLTQ